MAQVLLVSVKPEFAEKIFSGKKKIELRKAAPNVSPGDLIVIYSTTPVKAVIGIGEVGGILKMPPSRMWKLHGKILGIDKKRFFQYYEDIQVAVGIVLTSTLKFPNQLSLEEIKEKHPFFHPPQTFRYYNESLFEIDLLRKGTFFIKRAS